MTSGREAMMTSDAQALVRQLTENPEVLESMQHMLSLLRANPSICMQNSTTNIAPTANSSSQRVRPPRAGYKDGDDALPNADPHVGYNTAASGCYHHHSTYRNNNRYDDAQGEEKGVSSPMLTLADTDRRGGGGGRNAAGREPRRSSNQQQQQQQASEELLAASKKLSEAQRRIAELEQELQRTTQRVDQLSGVVQKQKGELQDAQDRHTLELEEMRHVYDAVVRRKDEVQEEALRQLMKSRQLMRSAAKYEATVAATKKEKENSTIPITQGSAVGLTASATAVNMRYSSHLQGSGLKRERHDNSPEGRNAGKQDGYYASNPQQQQQVSKCTASDSWGAPTSLGRVCQGTSHHDTTTSSSNNDCMAAYTKTESPEFTTSSTPMEKSSTTLVGGRGGGRETIRTQSRSAKKRRTPRTPSLTHADRLATTTSKYRSSNNDHCNRYYAAHPTNSGSAPAPRQLLPGTSSLKLDSPTPVVSTAWTVGRSLTSSPTPPPLSVPTAYTATSAKPPPEVRMQSTKRLLTQRTAGRLPAAAAAAAPPLQSQTIARAVPNARSGTSSVVADGPTRSPSPVDPKRGNAGPRRFIFTGLKDDEPQRLAATIAKIGDDAAVLASELDEVPPTSTTHIVLRGTPRSVKALCGVVSGKWLVSPEYITNSLESGFWLDELDEGGMRIFPPPLQGQRFLLTVEHDGIRGKLAQVIEYGGGEVLPVYSGKVAQDVVVITSGDDLLRYATEGHM